ncbi:MAG: hypothetical protein ACLFR7_06360 [Opitutales bacterium]
MKADHLLAELRAHRPLPAGPSPGEEAHWFGELGYHLGGPLCVAFLQWILAHPAARKCEWLCFLARDGWIMQQCFEAAGFRTSAPAPDLYLLASRRALTLATLRRVDAQALAFFTSGRLRYSAEDCLRRLGIAREPARTALATEGFDTPHQRLQEADLPRLHRVLRGLEPLLLAQAREEATAYRAYLRQFGLTPGTRLAVIDIGWHGSMVRHLDALLGAGSAPTCTGFLLGRHAPRVQDASCSAAVPIHGFLFEGGEPAEHAQSVRHCVELVEFFFAHTEPSLVRFEGAAGEPRPVFDGERASPAQDGWTQAVQAGMRAFAADFRAAGGTAREALSRAAVMAPLARLLRQPTAAEGRLLGAVEWSDGFGPGQRLQPLARKSPIARNLLAPGRFKREFKQAYWRAGYAAQLSGLERALLRVLAPVGMNRLAPPLRERV